MCFLCFVSLLTTHSNLEYWHLFWIHSPHCWHTFWVHPPERSFQVSTTPLQRLLEAKEYKTCLSLYSAIIFSVIICSYKTKDMYSRGVHTCTTDKKHRISKSNVRLLHYNLSKTVSSLALFCSDSFTVVSFGWLMLANVSMTTVTHLAVW